MQKEEFIQNYIADRLSDNDKARFEELLKTDSEFQEAYETHKEMATAFQLANSEEIKKRLQAIDTEETTTQTKRFFQLHFSKIAIAAAFVLGIFFTINVLRSNGDLYESYFETCPNTYLPVTRGESQSDIHFEAFKAYESGAYETAETIFNDALKTDNNPTIRFYYAMSLLNQEKFELALAELASLQTMTFDYQVESLWYAALIHLKNKNDEQAKKNLLAIQNLQKDFKSEEIQEILDSI